MQRRHVYRPPPQWRSPQLYQRRAWEAYRLGWLYDRTTQQVQELIKPLAGWDSNSVPYSQSPDVQSGDILIAPLTTNAPGSHAITMQTDGGLQFDLQNDASRQIVHGLDIYSVAQASFYGSTDQSVNGTIPIVPEPGIRYFFTLGIPITPIDFSTAPISPYGDTLTVVALGSAPTGLLYTGVVLSGRPTVEGDYLTQSFRVTDPYGLSAEWDVEIIVAEFIFDDSGYAYGWPRGRPSRRLPRWHWY